MPDRHASSNAASRAAYVLRMHALSKLEGALRDRGLDALLVKGAALAMTHYDEPWTRAMGDVDLVARPGACGRTLKALAAHGFVAGATAGRPLSGDFFGETGLTLDCGATSVLLELHTGLDKLVARPVDYEAIFARASPAPGLPHVLLPSDEDHVLLLALHAAGHDFLHEPACADLDLLLARGVDEAALLHRARQWRLGTVLFVMLSLLRERGSARVPDRLLATLAPGALRRAAVGVYRSRLATPGASESLGWPWIARQTVLRDDLPAWARGVLAYAWARAVERAFLAPPEAPRKTDCPEARRAAR